MVGLWDGMLPGLWSISCEGHVREMIGLGSVAPQEICSFRKDGLAGHGEFGEEESGRRRGGVWEDDIKEWTGKDFASSAEATRDGTR